MNILVTSSRAPVALDLIRAFAHAGHTVFASDTVCWTVSSHSRYLARHFVTSPPRHAPDSFARELQAIVVHQQIDWLIPTSEEVFYVARCHAVLAAHTRVFTEPLALLTELHHKYRFGQHCAALGITTPRTALIDSNVVLQELLPRFPRFLLKPAFSRFATRIITNCGVRAGRLPLSACDPTPAQPWVLQEFIDGTGICTYSTLHNGRVTAHCAYQTPRTVDGGAGVQFRSVDGAATLTIAEKLGRALNYTGQLSLDFIENERGLHILECNPRATSGLHLLAPATLVGAITQPDAPLLVAPAGRTRQLTAAMLASGAAHPAQWRELFRQAVLVGDVVFQPDDPLPALVQLVAAAGFGVKALRRGMSMTKAMTENIEWNGER